MTILSSGDGTVVERRLARGLSLILIPAVGLSAWAMGGAIWPLLTIASALAAAGWLANGLQGRAESILLALVLVGQGMAFTAAFAGHPWQLDSHMLFFALLAIVATLRCIVALLTGAAAVALHHLVLSLVMPALIFPVANLAEGLGRVAFHACIVVLEVTFLAAMIVVTQRQAKSARSAQDKAIAAASHAEKARKQAESLQHSADAASKASRAMTDVLGQNLERLLASDLTGRIGSAAPEDYTELARTYDVAVEHLADALREAQDIVVRFELEAGNAARMTDAMALRFERQAQEVTETANAVRELTASVGQTSEAIIDVRARAETASVKASEGAGIVRAAVDAMSEIRSSSGEIEKIIHVIEEISFQTNLLALNAGVEAARAGSAGAGFAVVATEVRALAHRTSEAANQVKGLISTSASKVTEGVNLVDRAGGALEEIEAVVVKASAQVNDIAHEATSQTNALQVMTESIDVIDAAIQTFVSQTEEISANNTKIAADAAVLERRLSGFDLSKTPALGKVA